MTAHGTAQPVTPLIAVEDVHYTYGGAASSTPTAALRGASLTVSPGERIALLGRNGSGKTTLAKHLNGLLQPQRGRVVVGGLDTAHHDVGKLAQVVGYVFQNPDHQLFSPTVREELSFGPRNLGAPPDEVERRVAETLAAFDLESIVSLPPATLGFAQRRAVAIASVVTMRPAALVLDEPFAGLDWTSVTRIGSLLTRLAETGTAVIVITHQMRAVAYLSARCVLLDDGCVLADAPARETLARADLLAHAGLAPPATVRIGQGLRSHGFSGTSTRVDELLYEYTRLRAHRAPERRRHAPPPEPGH